ncbi:MAG: hypothetical protein ACMVO5_12695 [Polymorphobacter sp.]|uniref:hypothetical protein n=1 Tax=Polymorphobacter sp. TaxID=1909290 RepID=UPI003A887680
MLLEQAVEILRHVILGLDLGELGFERGELEADGVDLRAGGGGELAAAGMEPGIGDGGQCCERRGVHILRGGGLGIEDQGGGDGERAGQHQQDQRAGADGADDEAVDDGREDEGGGDHEGAADPAAEAGLLPGAGAGAGTRCGLAAGEAGEPVFVAGKDGVGIGHQTASKGEVSGLVSWACACPSARAI